MQFSVSLPELHKPSTFAPDACACTSRDEKSVVFGNGYARLPSTLPPASVTNAAVSRCSCWPNT